MKRSFLFPKPLAAFSVGEKKSPAGKSPHLQILLIVTGALVSANCSVWGIAVAFTWYLQPALQSFISPTLAYTNVYCSLTRVFSPKTVYLRQLHLFLYLFKFIFM